MCPKPMLPAQSTVRSVPQGSPQHAYRRLKLGLAYRQVLYVVAKDAGRDLSAVDSFRWSL
jgi:hypothetical protein